MRTPPHFCTGRWEGFEERDILLAPPGSPGKYIFVFPARCRRHGLAHTGPPTFCLPKKLPTLQLSASHHLTLCRLLSGWEELWFPDCFPRPLSLTPPAQPARGAPLVRDAASTLDLARAKLMLSLVMLNSESWEKPCSCCVNSWEGNREKKKKKTKTQTQKTD